MFCWLGLLVYDLPPTSFALHFDFGVESGFGLSTFLFPGLNKYCDAVDMVWWLWPVLMIFSVFGIFLIVFPLEVFGGFGVKSCFLWRKFLGVGFWCDITYASLF